MKDRFYHYYIHRCGNFKFNGQHFTLRPLGSEAAMYEILIMHHYSLLLLLPSFSHLVKFVLNVRERLSHVPYEISMFLSQSQTYLNGTFFSYVEPKVNFSNREFLECLNLLRLIFGYCVIHVCHR